MFSWTHTQTSLNLSNFPLATAQVPPGVKSGWKASFLLFHSGLVVRSSQHTCCCCSPTLTPHPRGSMFSPILLVARSASALARSPTFVFLASSLRLVISGFSQPSSLSHLGLGSGWVAGCGGGLSCLNNTNRSLRNEERGGRGRRRRSRQAGVRKKKDTKRPKIGGLSEQIKKKSDS